MKSSVKALIIAVVTVVLLGGGVILYNSLGKSYEAKKPADTTDTSLLTEDAGDTTDFTFYDIDGNAVSLSDFRGKPVVLNFWASWCGPCRSEMPELQKAYEQYSDSVQFLMIDLSGNGNDDRDDALSVISDNGYTFPVYFDNDSAGARAYSVSSIPSTYFIDGDGNLSDYQIGMLTESRLAGALEKLVK